MPSQPLPSFSVHPSAAPPRPWRPPTVPALALWFPPQVVAPHPGRAVFRHRKVKPQNGVPAPREDMAACAGWAAIAAAWIPGGAEWGKGPRIRTAARYCPSIRLVVDLRKHH